LDFNWISRDWILDVNPIPGIHPNNQLRWQSIRSNFNQRDDSGKASASEEKPTTKRDPDDVDEMKRRQVQKQKLSEESKDRHQQSFQDNVSRKKTTPQASLLSDQHDLGFHPESSLER